MNPIQIPVVTSVRTHLHTCPVPGCTSSIKLTLAMCHSHWNLVPSALKKAVLDTYRTAPGSPAHLAALTAAVNAVKPARPRT